MHTQVYKLVPLTAPLKVKPAPALGDLTGHLQRKSDGEWALKLFHYGRRGHIQTQVSDFRQAIGWLRAQGAKWAYVGEDQKPIFIEASV